MDDKMKESISALMDDEANEIEIQRLLSKSDSKDLLDTWKRYHNARDVMSGMSGRTVDVNISSKVAAAIRGEAQVYTGDEQPKPSAQASAVNVVSAVISEGDSVSSNRAWKFGGAIAACLVVVLGYNNFGGLASHDSVQSASSDVVLEANQLVMNDLNESQVSSFNQYLLRHSELSTVTVASGVAPLIRVASVNSVGI